MGSAGEETSVLDVLKYICIIVGLSEVLNVSLQIGFKVKGCTAQIRLSFKTLTLGLLCTFVLNSFTS